MATPFAAQASPPAMRQAEPTVSQAWIGSTATA
jgi:hypothetical protein